MKDWCLLSGPVLNIQKLDMIYFAQGGVTQEIHLIINSNAIIEQNSKVFRYLFGQKICSLDVPNCYKYLENIIIYLRNFNSIMNINLSLFFTI